MNQEHLKQSQDENEPVNKGEDNVDQTENMTENSVVEGDTTSDIQNDELSQLKEQNAQLNDKLLRLQAEFDNFRKRNAKERLELIQTAGADVMSSLLEVLDDTDRSLASMDTATDIDQLREGVKLVFHKFKRVLQSQGLTPMDVVGQDFNPDQQEAITEIPAGEDKVGKVVDVVQVGYMLNDKIIRYAKVVVGK